MPVFRSPNAFGAFSYQVRYMGRFATNPVCVTFLNDFRLGAMARVTTLRQGQVLSRAQIGSTTKKTRFPSSPSGVAGHIELDLPPPLDAARMIPNSDMARRGFCHRLCMRLDRLRRGLSLLGCRDSPKSYTLKGALLAILLVFLLTGCGANTDTITGQVFIVTQSGDNVKLGLVTVALMSLKEVKQHITEKKAIMAAQRKEIESAIEAAEAELLTAEKRYQAKMNAAASIRAKADREFDAAVARREGLEGATYQKMIDANLSVAEHIVAAQPLKREVDLRSAAVIRLQEQLASVDFGPLYMDGLPEAKARAQTDANGEFTIQVPRRGAFALAAHAERRVFEVTEDYTWLVSIPDEARKGTKLLLSNETLTRGGSPLSLVHTAK